MSKDKFLLLGFLFFLFFVMSYVSDFNRISSIKAGRDVDTLPKDIEERLKNSIPSATFRVPVLMYHYVEYVADPGDTIRKSLNIVPFVFENQLKTLKEAGYTFITPSELGIVLKGKGKLPHKPIILSFDDGYQDFYDNVFPLLEKYNAKAVDYVISGFLDHPNFMYSWEVTDLSKRGLVEIGAHTVHHLELAGMQKAKAEYEITESKRQLEQLTGKPVVSFAYPSGSFDLQAEKLVEAAGYSTAVSTVPGIQVTDTNRFFLYRIRPGGRMGENLINYLSQNSFKTY